MPCKCKSIIRPERDNNQTLQNHTPQIQTLQNHTPQNQTLQNHTPQNQTFQNHTPQNQTFQNHTPQITRHQTKENDSDLNPVIPVVVRPAMEESPNKPVVNAPVSVDARNETNRFAESAEKKRAAQASLIESFKKKRKECRDDRNENLYLDSDGDLVEMVSSRSPSAQTRSPCHKITVP